MACLNRLRRLLATPPVDWTPTGSRSLDIALNVIDGLEIAVLLVSFIAFGRRPKDWGPRS